MRFIQKNIDNINQNNTQKELLKYLIKHSVASKIYSEDGIFITKSNDLYKLIFNNKINHNNKVNHNNNLNIDLLQLNNYIIDYSNETLSKTKTYQIPFNHIKVQYDKYVYKITSNSKLQFIVEKENNIISNVYFYTNSYICDKVVQKDLDTFLSIIN